jgi:hypothetical protein
LRLFSYILRQFRDNAVSQHGIDILAQYLQTDPEVGYVVLETEVVGGEGEELLAFAEGYSRHDPRAGAVRPEPAAGVMRWRYVAQCFPVAGKFRAASIPPCVCDSIFGLGSQVRARFRRHREE